MMSDSLHPDTAGSVQSRHGFTRQLSFANLKGEKSLYSILPQISDDFSKSRGTLPLPLGSPTIRNFSSGSRIARYVVLLVLFVFGGLYVTSLWRETTQRQILEPEWKSYPR